MTVGILGLGLIGGSLGLALRAAGVKVVGRDRVPEIEAAARDLGCVDATGSIEDCDVVFVAVPPEDVSSAVAAVPESVAAVSDCASVKAPILREVNHPRFVGGHPMAGKETGGLTSAEANLFSGSSWILCPGSDPVAVETVAEVLRLIHVKPVLMSAEVHDRHVALLSHLPHVIAATLTSMAKDLSFPEIAAGSWRDMTRVAVADQALWNQILKMNADGVASAAEALAASLTASAARLRAGQTIEPWDVSE